MNLCKVIGSQFVVRGILFFDTLYKSTEAIETDISEWSHKETPKERYAVLDKDEFDHFIGEGFETPNFIYKTMSEAIEEANELL